MLSALSAALAVAFPGLLSSMPWLHPCLCSQCLPGSRPLSPCPNGHPPFYLWFSQFSKVGRAQLCSSSEMLGSAPDLHKGLCLQHLGWHLLLPPYIWSPHQLPLHLYWVVWFSSHQLLSSLCFLILLSWLTVGHPRLC